MLQIISLALSLLIGSETIEANEMIWNIWADTQATNNGLLDSRYYEDNPYWNYIFTKVGYENAKYVNDIYIISMAILSRVIPEPYDSLIFCKIYSLYGFLGAYSWRNTGYLKYPIRLTLMRLEW